MDEQGSSTRDEVRSRRRNVTLDWDGIDEERKRSLKQTRGNAKRALTIAMNKAGESLLVGNSVEEVRLIQVSLDQVFENFSQTCDSYRETLESEDDQDECMAYFHETQLKYLCMKDRIVLRLESIHPIQQTHSDENREDSEWRLTPKDLISRQSKHLLNLLSSKPIICLKELNPALFNFVQDLQDVRALREQILNMKKYLVSCRLAVQDKLLLLLQERQHFVENSDMYTIQDLITVDTGVLLEELSVITASFGKHIKFDCVLCQGRGFICEICRASDVIFPFDFNSVKCNMCLSTFHRACFHKGNCPRCKRMSTRKNTS